MKKLFLITLLAQVLLLAQESKQNMFQTESFLTQTTIQINKVLPLTVNSDTRLDKVWAKEKNLFYSYTLLQYSKANVKAKELNGALKMQAIHEICTDPSIRIYVQNGVTINHIYSDQDAKRITEFKVLPSDCGFKD
ncbi:MAG: hypothetical protein U9N30_05305 [Campylobacterota bacterium]|nr:hypothetical protein [Campylobacterota bacterium]